MKLNKYFFLGFALVVMFSFVGCNKKLDTIAKIYVLDANNNVVSGATVQLMPQSSLPTGVPAPIDTEVWPMETTTNTAGEATFSFNDVYQEGQAGVVVVDITASNGSSIGQGVIKVEQETTSEETVYIQ